MRAARAVRDVGVLNITRHSSRDGGQEELYKINAMKGVRSGGTDTRAARTMRDVGVLK